MAMEYLGLSDINGPLVAVDGVKGVGFALARRHGGYGKPICDALREAGGVFVGVSRGTDDGEREQTI